MTNTEEYNRNQTDRENSERENEVIQAKPTNRKRTREDHMKAGWKKMMDYRAESMYVWLELTKEVRDTISNDDLDHPDQLEEPDVHHVADGGRPH